MRIAIRKIQQHSNDSMRRKKVIGIFMIIIKLVSTFYFDFVCYSTQHTKEHTNFLLSNKNNYKPLNIKKGIFVLKKKIRKVKLKYETFNFFNHIMNCIFCLKDINVTINNELIVTDTIFCFLI